MLLSRAPEIKDRIQAQPFLSPTELRWELQGPGSDAAGWARERECARVRVYASVCARVSVSVCARVAFRQLSRPPPIAPGPAPGRLPRACEATPVRPGFKGPARQLQPLRGAGRRGGWCGKQKSRSPQPASPAPGWVARSEVRDRRSQLLAAARDAASQRPASKTA